MSYSFDEIMAYHPDNMDVYQEIKQLLPKLIPFVGAGLTHFAYYSWPDALKELSGKLSNYKDAQKVNDFIDTMNYLEAAQLLEDLRTPMNLSRDLATLFASDKLMLNQKKLPEEPISLLPHLFPELVLTTNFDETLETVYRESGHPFQSVFLPGHPELLRQFTRQGNTSGLFKLHGTVTGKLIEYEKIVFTLKQYDKHYGIDSPLTNELKHCFEQRIMLFLGCSLENDRTMELLQTVIQPGNYYYAIIDCAKSERDEKIRQLGEKHIRTILYEENRHEAVRVILEHLLEETAPDDYDALPVHVGTLKSVGSSERFSFKADILGFKGRKEELCALKCFLNDDEHISFRWWAIVGPGGCGKSRLAYHFQTHELPSGWSSHYLGAIDYINLFSLTERFAQKVLLIVDYVQENAKGIGKWLEWLNDKKRSLPIRVLLLERGMYDDQSASGWLKQLYADVRDEKKLKSACYSNNFLELPPLPDDNLLDIIEEYASTLKQSSEHSGRVLSDTKKQSLLQTLKSVDPGLCRPLYAMFLTDAYMSGQNPEKWDRDDVLEYVTTREQKRLEFNIRQVLGKSDEKLFAACLHLQSMATVLHDSTLEKLQVLCPEAWNTIEKKSDSFVSPSSMLEQIGLTVKGQVSALRPDLIGEYFVYTWLLGYSTDARQFLCTAWQEPLLAAVFFNRMFYDYSYLLNEDAKYWELILSENIPSSEDDALYYATLLVNTIYYCSSVEECERQVNLLEKMALIYPENPNFILMFSNGLCNLILKQEEQSAYATTEHLKKLVAEHLDTPGISIALANGLLNLSIKQEEQKALNTIKHLETLAIEHPDVPDITNRFAQSLCNLSLM